MEQISVHLAEWVVAFGTIALAIVVAFQDRIRSWIFKPNLKFAVKSGKPDCAKVPANYEISDGRRIETDSYYLRFRVVNEGDIAAKMVEVSVTELYKLQADGKFKKSEDFIPLNLLWSHFDQPYLVNLPPSTEKHCGFGHIIDPKKRYLISVENNPALKLSNTETSFYFEFVVKSYRKDYIFPPGTYKCTLQVAAENAKPRCGTVQLNLTGKWFDDEDQMLSQGFGISLV